MTDTITNFIKSIEGNSLIVTLVSGGIVFTLFRYLTDIVGSVWRGLLTLISFQIFGRYNTEYDFPDTLKKLMYLLNTKSKILWMKEMELMKVQHNEDNDNRLAAVPHGISYRWMYGCLICVRKSYDQNGLKLATIIDIRIFFKSKKKFFEEFLTDMRNIQVREDNNHILVDTYGSVQREKDKRPMKTVYSSDNITQIFLDDVKKFLSNEKIYKECDIPYKRNYLLYGKPGTGKSSSVLALASEIDWSIMCIDISKNRIDDVINNLLTRSKTIFLFEDIDVATRDGARKDKKCKNEYSEHYGEPLGEISLGELLNITDGLITPKGSICIFTTNHIEDLDDAFLRDGRMDRKFEFKYFNGETANQMIFDKLGFKVNNIKDDICPATLQEDILQVLLGNKTKEDFQNGYRK